MWDLRSTTLFLRFHLLFPFIIFFCLFSFSLASSLDGDKNDLDQWRRSIFEEPSATVKKVSFILAADRTYRQDPTNGYKYYTGGWNISNEHYWTSVASTAYPLFIAALLWFVVFGLVLLLICCCCCCCRRKSYSYSRIAYALSLILLIIFTIAAMVGCAVLYTGQGKFNKSTSSTLDYVVGQANLTVENLSNFSSNLAAAKKVSIEQILLPAEAQAKIDMVQKKLKSAADELASRTKDNSRTIRTVLQTVRLDLIILSAVMLGLAFLGFFFSVLGLQWLVSVLVILGWILVTITFISTGVFLLLHNVVADTCDAMDEWVLHPQAHTALDDILPCVDAATANEFLYQSKEVTSQLVNVVNQVVSNISNSDIPPFLGPPLYYNQSGPLLPLVCNPYNADMTNRTCSTGEVELLNAAKVWQHYKCKTSKIDGGDICVTTGRITPEMYNQLTAAITVSQGLNHYAPFLADLQDCTFVRDTFTSISEKECPGLEMFSKWIYTGLLMVSIAVMLSLVFWLVYARERRHRKFGKQVFYQNSHVPFSNVP
ncbi:hypothetical protein IHE45_08G113300 [Dioscorea alata]|uniref:Uncharacterized protein n=2 Tax=Dioscorea alata TaxID=55571 RepID=A0ACB7VLQ7_DIOAL|nr:hypothetical protein IHE45_08G113300 [Dioscorea alata]